MNSLRQTTRRRFVWSMAKGAVGAMGASPLLLPQSAGASPRAEAFEKVKQTGRAFGGSVELTVWHPDTEKARRAIAAVLDELERIESIMSVYRPESQLSRLNRHRLLEAPDHRLLDVLATARDISRRSEGAFDITVQPLWDLFRRAQQEGTAPSEADIRRVVSRVDYRSVVVTQDGVRIKEPKASITLNGIAQGYALDRAATVLAAHEIRHAIIDTGEIGACGKQVDGEAWRAGIQHPRVADAFIAVAKLDGRCLATSGDYATSFTDDHRNHHVFDPRTGHSPLEVASVTVAAPSGMLADALSTTLCVLGPRRGCALLAAFPRCDALFVLKNQRVLRTANFPLETPS